MDGARDKKYILSKIYITWLGWGTGKLIE